MLISKRVNVRGQTVLLFFGKGNKQIVIGWAILGRRHSPAVAPLRRNPTPMPEA
jgi:hypothetical protein